MGRDGTCDVLSAVLALLIVQVHAPALQAPGTPVATNKISLADGGLPQSMQLYANFGDAVDWIGDLDGDGHQDLVVGTRDDLDDPVYAGAIWILFLDEDGSVKQARKHSKATSSALAGLQVGDRFGCSVAFVGDLDGDGDPELAVGAYDDDTGSYGAGAVHLVSLAPDGGLTHRAKIAAQTPGLLPAPIVGNAFGWSVAGLGDIDRDGVPDLAVGATGYAMTGAYGGAVWVLRLSSDGSIKGSSLLFSGSPGLPQLPPAPSMFFGMSLCSPGDLDGDGRRELVVGAHGAAVPLHGPIGAAWVVFLEADGSARKSTLLTEGWGGFGASLSGSFNFAAAVGAPGDLNGDGVPDLAIGAPATTVGVQGVGAVHVLLLNSDGTTSASSLITTGSGGLQTALGQKHYFGTALPPGLHAPPGRLPVGASGDHVGVAKGRLWMLSLDALGEVSAETSITPDEQPGWPLGPDTNDGFGSVLGAWSGPLGAGPRMLLAGLPSDLNDATGTFWNLGLTPAASVASISKYGPTPFGLPVATPSGLTAGGRFGSAVCELGDLDGDGLIELAIGERRAAISAAGQGAAWIIELDATGAVEFYERVAPSPGVPQIVLAAGDEFGSSLTRIGDLDGDGITELAVGAPHDDDGGFDTGAVWVLFLRSDASVKSAHKLSKTRPGGALLASLHAKDRFGASVAPLGDLDLDGIPDLAVGAPRDDEQGTDAGALRLLFMNADGSVRDVIRIAGPQSDFTGATMNGYFGASLALLPDLDADGIPELAVGAPTAGGTGLPNGSGSFWIFSLRRDGSLRTARRIAGDAPALSGALALSDQFGTALASLGDIDGNGLPEVAVGAPYVDDVVFNAGAIWVLQLATGMWTKLGGGLPGAHGAPVMAPTGELPADMRLSFELSNAPPRTPCWLVLGGSVLNAPFKGGLLVPMPDLVVAATTDDAGRKALGGLWPDDAPAGLTIVAQWWVVDDGTPTGLAASHGVSASTP